MSDLISRSVLLGVMQKLSEREHGVPLSMIKWFMEVIAKAPTAYDVDKVVKELEENATKNFRTSEAHEEYGECDLSQKFYEISMAYAEAIEIVRGGGVNERDS